MRSRRQPSTIANFVPTLLAIVAFVATALIPHPAMIVAVLIGDAVTIVAIADFVGIRYSESITRHWTNRAITEFGLICVYALLANAVVGYPLLWLIRDRSLGATLALSTLVVIALLGVWKVWPAFGLICLRRNPWSTSKTLEEAQRLGTENEIYFSHGLAVSVAILMLAVGAAAVAGFGSLFRATRVWPPWPCMQSSFCPPRV